MNIAVYCGSSFGNNPNYAKCAKELGKWIGKNHHTLIYGGGLAGLMGDVAKSVLDYGGQAVSVVPPFLLREEDERLTKQIMVKDMSERKKTMIQLADAYIALPGGPGTLEEISEIISLRRLRRIDKPYCLYNIDHFYDELMTYFNKMVRAGFIEQHVRDEIHFASDLNEVVKYLEKH